MLLSPLLTGIVVHWRDEDSLERLVKSWSPDPRFELIIVDNSSSCTVDKGRYQVLDSGRNLGFSGGVNRALELVVSPYVLILNTDVVLKPNALESLVEGFTLNPEAAGLVPKLMDFCGTSQHRWQLRSLPSPLTLILQTLLVPAGQGPRIQPIAGSPIGQPAGAALALRRKTLVALGGFDTRFHPAWFEDVDFARRLADAGHELLYWPAACLLHEKGVSVSTLGYRWFLWCYYRNLVAYLQKHHSRSWTAVARASLMVGLTLRLVMVPIWKPKRAKSRREAISGLATAVTGAVTGWRSRPSGARPMDLDPESCAEES